MTDKEYMLGKLSEESDMVIATAYLYAVNIFKFRKDVTEKWLTAVTQSMALDEAYVRGRIDADNEWRERLNDAAERKAGKWEFVHPLQEDDGGAYVCSCCKTGSWEIDPTRWKACPWCTALMEVDE